ncbi:MAG TPA: MFS transporter [Thermoleophilaceae bacterium]|nr:MFS transporter [Thermoleophilaceae bacterium]
MGARRRLLPLVLATMATQASIVVLAPLLVEIGRDFGASLGEVGLARSVLAGTAVVVSIAIGPQIDRYGVGPLIAAGGALAMLGAGAAAGAPSLPWFLAANLVVGAGVACMLSAGFAGVATYFSGAQVEWAMGWVVGSQAAAWIVGTPVIGFLAEHGSWRLAFVVPALVGALALAAGLMAPRGRAIGGLGVREGLTAVLREPSARRWTIAELVAYSAWTAEITYAGAFYIETYGLGEATVGLLLPIGSVVFLVTSTNTSRLTARFARRPVIALAAVGMGLVLVPVLNWTPAVGATVAMVCVTACFAAVRSAGSSALGLAQLPDNPGSMMGARTAAAQLGYVLGAAGGGIVIELLGFGALGFALFAGMLASALLVMRVSDPLAPARAGPRYPEPVPD